MSRPLLGDRPLTATEKNKRHREKVRRLAAAAPQSSEQTAEALLKLARREILELRREVDRLRAEAAQTGKPAPAVPDGGPLAPLPLTEAVNRASAAEAAAPSSDASARALTLAEVVERARAEGRPVSLFDIMNMAED